MSDQPLFNENSLDAKISELLVLQRLDAEDRAEFRKEVKAQLKGLTERADYTNGRIGEAILKIAEIERIRDENKSDLDQIVAAKRFAQRFLLNKYALIAGGLFTIGAIRVLSDDQARGILFKILGIG